MIAVNNSLTVRKGYSSREYFRALGRIKRCKWIQKSACFPLFYVSYCQKVIMLPKIACCTKEHFARHQPERCSPSSSVCTVQSGNAFFFLFRVSTLQMFINQLFSTSTTVVTILSFENLAKKSKYRE